MCQRFLALAVLFLAPAVFPASAVFTSPAANGQTSIDAEHVLEKALAKYRGLNHFQFVRTTEIKELRGGEPPSQIAELTFTTATIGADPSKEHFTILPLNPDRFRLDLASGGNSFVLVKGDQGGWWYSSKTKTYQKNKGLPVAGSAPDSMFVAFHMLPFITLKKGIFQDARVVREESVKVGKRELKCFVIQGTATTSNAADLLVNTISLLMSGKPEGSTRFPGIGWMITILQAQGFVGDQNRLSIYVPEEKTTKVTLWIDKSDYLLVRTEMTAKFSKTTRESDRLVSNEEHVEVTLTDAFSELRIVRDIPEEHFQFKPPADAKEVIQEIPSQPK